MKRSIKHLAFLLATMMLASLCLSCNQTTAQTDVTKDKAKTESSHQLTTSASDDSDPPHVHPSIDAIAFHDLPEEERTVVVAYTEGSNGSFTRRSLKADEIDESDVDVATKARDARLKEQFGLELELISTGGIASMADFVKTSLASGNGDFDILAGYQYYALSLATENYLLNLNDLKSHRANFIDLDASYWGKAYNDNLSYKGGYYWITGDLALRYIGGMYCTYVNANTYNEKLAGEYGSIYAIAKDGRWTIDLLTEMAAKCYEDTGDIFGEPDEADSFGFGWEPNDILDAMALGMNAQFTSRDPDTGALTVAINNQHTFDIINKMQELTKTGDFSYQFPNSDSTAVMPAFASGKVAFTINKLYQADAYLWDMEDGYYIIPVPKFDRAQEHYITPVHEGCTVFAIPYDSTKVAQAAVALEFLCAYSSENVAYLFFENALMGRYTRDPEAATMIDLIHASVTTDFGVAWGNSIKELGYFFRPPKASTVTIGRRVVEWQKALNELTDHLEPIRI